MRYYDYSPMYQAHSYFWEGGIISLLLNILIWGLIIYLIVHLVKKIAGHHHGGCCGMCGDHGQMQEKSDEYYLDIAKERYVKGEIDKKHFDDLKKEFSPKIIEDEEVETEKSKE